MNIILLVVWSRGLGIFKGRNNKLTRRKAKNGGYMKEIGDAYEQLFNCFESVCFKRIDRGASEEQVIEYLKHLKNDVWNKNRRVCNYLQGMIEGFEADISFNK